MRNPAPPASSVAYSPAVGAPVPPWVPRRATRDTEAPFLGGVAAGLARHLGLPVLWVRVGFVATTALGMFGLMVYAALWWLLPSAAHFEISTPGLESATRTGKRPRGRARLADVGPAIALGALTFGVLLSVGGALGQAFIFWPLMLGIAGIALVWRQADEAQRERWSDSSSRIDPMRALLGSGGWAAWVRLALGLGLVLAALVGTAFVGGAVASTAGIVTMLVVGMLGLGLALGPLVVRLVSDLGAERDERIRTQERADLAAHLHDSVLQTLALIQRNAGDAEAVARLARSQERELRAWLYTGDNAEPSTVAGALREHAARIEDERGVVVDVVTVGDTEVTEQLRPLIAAAGEAITNSAKHAGTGRVDVFGEVEPTSVAVFVRDRGVGFDPDSIATDRHGVRDSILDRMRRHGGTASITSEPGAGTNVRLTMPRNPEEQTDRQPREAGEESVAVDDQ